VGLLSRVLLPAGAIEVSLMLLYLLARSSFQERRRSVLVGYLPEVFSGSEEYAMYFACFGMGVRCGMDGSLLFYVQKTLKKNWWSYAYNVFRILLIETEIFNNYKRIIRKKSNNEEYVL
jgi:hypothetical protein